MRATLGRQGSGVKLRASGMAARSGSLGRWPTLPAANPANPAPFSNRSSRCATGTSFALGFPCMSTNCAKRNSTPVSRTYARTSSRSVGSGAAPEAVMVAPVSVADDDMKLLSKAAERRIVQLENGLLRIKRPATPRNNVEHLYVRHHLTCETLPCTG